MTINIEAIVNEAANTIPYELNMVIYDNGTVAYLSQNSYTAEEFNNETKRVATLDLSRVYWLDTFLDNEINIDSFNPQECNQDFITYLKESLTYTLLMQLDNQE